jgi:hypothetical protein
MLRKKLDLMQSTSQGEAKSLWPVNPIVFLATYIVPRARGRRQFTISRQLLGSHQLSTGPINPFGFIMPWHGYFGDEDEFDDANTHIEQAKSNTDDGSYYRGLATEMQAGIFYRQFRLEEAKSEILHAMEIYKKLGAANDVGDCKELLRKIERTRAGRPVSGKPDTSCEIS